MLFIVKKKKEKKMKLSVTKKKKKKSQLTDPLCTKLEGEEETGRKVLEVEGPSSEELYELFKDYFHMAASNIEDFAVRVFNSLNVRIRDFSRTLKGQHPSRKSGRGLGRPVCGSWSGVGNTQFRNDGNGQAEGRPLGHGGILSEHSG